MPAIWSMPTVSTSTVTRRSSPSASPAASASARPATSGAVPPLERRLTVDPNRRGTLPYEIGR